jgi:hypothetical protein
MEDVYNQQRSPPRSWRSAILIALFGLIGGLGLAGWGISKSPAAQHWLFGAEKAQPEPAITFAPRTVQPPAPTLPAPEAIPTDVAARMAALEARVAKVESAAAGAHSSARAESLLIAFAARRALDRGLALGYVEGQLTQYFGQSQPRAVAMIIAAARQPVTLDGLKAGLDEIAPKLTGASADEGWWESIKHGLSGLIVVRQANAPSPHPVDRIAQAREMVGQGRVDQALAEIARLPNRADAANWMAAARRHIEAYRALDLLEAAAIMNVGEQELPKVPPPPVEVPPLAPKDVPSDTF